jgi:hypothetical protein
VLFSMTQNLGGLIGSSLLGSYQYIATQAHAVALSEQLVLQDPQVAERIAVGARSLAGTLTDPGADTAQGVGLLAQAMTREATILAFNDVFQFVAVLAFGAALYVFYLILLDLWRQRRKVRAEAHA